MSRGLRVVVACALSAAGCDYVFRLDKVHYDGDAGADADLVNGPWKSVAAGAGTTCAIRRDDSLFCWGENAAGQLGLGHDEFRSEPTLVAPGTKWRDVVLAVSHTCGIQTDRSAWCWGQGSDGQLGNGMTDESLVPVLVTGGHDWTSIDAGNDVTCGIREGDRALLCWGDTDYGRLGYTTPGDNTVPTPVAGGHQWTSISLGDTHSCGVTMAGDGYCWGTNYSGELGAGAVGAQQEPYLVSNGLPWSTISAGWELSCGIAGGRAYCWGDGTTGALGTGSGVDRSTPFAVSTPVMDWVEIQASETHTCARRAGNSMWCWGDLLHAGTNGADVAHMPVEIAPDGTVDAIAVGKTHTCRHATGDAIACIGDGSVGQLGNGTTPAVNPQQVAHPESLTWDTVEAGEDNACAIDAGGKLYCWGQNVFGAVGDGTRARRLTPVLINDLTGWTNLTVGDDHACARNGAGNFECWGDDTGVSPNYSVTPTPISTELGNVSAGLHACALVNTNSAARCWGQNYRGQLGNNSTSAQSAPADVTDTRAFKAISASYEHTCAIDGSASASAGDALCWGRNEGGEGGTGSLMPINNLTATPVGGGHKFAQIFTGAFRSCGITLAGETLCWGRNYWSALGTADHETMPTAIHDSMNWDKLTLGDDHSCGLTKASYLRCWGRNQHGQIGDGSQLQRSAPTRPGTTEHAYRSVAAGANFTCGVRSDNTLWCWGYNGDGALGTGHGWTTKWTVPITPP